MRLIPRCIFNEAQVLWTVIVNVFLSPILVQVERLVCWQPPHAGFINSLGNLKLLGFGGAVRCENNV